jgi:acyl carrier protein
MAGNTEEKVTSILLGFLPPGASPRPDSTLFGELGLKSSVALHLLLALEGGFQISISDTEFAKVRTVGDLVGLADRLAGERVP